MANKKKQVGPLTPTEKPLSGFGPSQNRSPFTPEGGLDINRRIIEELWGKGESKRWRLRLLFFAIGLILLVAAIAMLAGLF